MEINYTTVTGYNIEQPNPEKSLGGFKSVTQIPNGDFSNLFDEISVLSIKNNRAEYRAIIFTNDTPDILSNAKISINSTEDAVCTYQLAVGVLSNQNKYGQLFMNSVQSQYSRPYMAEFVKMSVGVELVIGDIAPNAEVGIWVCREIDYEKASTQYETICKPDPVDRTSRRYIPVEKIEVESIDMVLNWD